MATPLDLSGADTSGFDPMPSGRYHCSVYEATMKETKDSPTAKLPPGTPMIAIQWQVHSRVDNPSDDANYENRRLFSNYVIPPKGYENEAKLKGMLVRFLVALGVGDESEVTDKKFSLDLEDLVGREAEVTVGQQPAYGGAEGEMQNMVKGVRPVGSGAVASSGLL